MTLLPFLFFVGLFSGGRLVVAVLTAVLSTLGLTVANRILSPENLMGFGEIGLVFAIAYVWTVMGVGVSKVVVEAGRSVGRRSRDRTDH